MNVLQKMAKLSINYLTVNVSKIKSLFRKKQKLQINIPTDRNNFSRTISKSMPYKTTSFSFAKEENKLSEDITTSNSNDIKLDDDPEIIENIKALERLKNMPRSSIMANNNSRIAAIVELLGKQESYGTIRKIRWPHGVHCPVCNSTNIVKLVHKVDSADKPFSYECLDCKANRRQSNFTDLTDMPEELEGFTINKVVLCWYLMSFCSISQIARELGMNVHQIAKIVAYLHNQVIIADEYTNTKDHKKKKEEEKRKKSLHVSADASAKQQADELDLQSRLKRRRDKEDIPDNKGSNKKKV